MDSMKIGQYLSELRKYYKITQDGELVLKKVKENWKEFSFNVNLLLEQK